MNWLVSLAEGAALCDLCDVIWKTGGRICTCGTIGLLVDASAQGENLYFYLSNYLSIYLFIFIY